MDLKAKVRDRRRAKAKAKARGKPKPARAAKPAKRRREDDLEAPSAGRVVARPAWDAGAWAPVAVPDEFWTGVDDAACLSLEELPGSSYTALRSGQNVEETVVEEDEEPTPRPAMDVTPDVAPDQIEAIRATWCEGPLSLRDELLASLSRMAFATPTPCQAACIPKILRGKDVVCAAQTGSGKTLAFALPALHDALANSTGVRSLVLAPTRELARQIAQHCVNALPRSVDAKRLVCCIVGGLAEQKQERQLALAPSIVVATPGRARELIEDGKAATVAKALEERTLRFLILDEADRLLAPGAFADFTLLTKRYLVDHKERPRKRWQTLVFSATLACGSTQPRDKKRKRQTDADPRALLKAVEPLRSPTRKLEVVDLTSRKEEDADEEEEETVALPSTLTLEAVRVVDAAKLATCYALLRGGSSKGKTVVFTNAISSVKTVASALQKLQIPRVHPLHAALQQRQRLKALDAFEKNDDAVLVASCVEINQ
jgi:ATP-dependent RNA helicase DDX24/MAK5